MGFGSSSLGSSSFGDDYGDSENESLVFLAARSPDNLAAQVEPNGQITFSIRSSNSAIDTTQVYIDSTLIYDKANLGFQLPYAGTTTPNAFGGLEFTLTSHPEWSIHDDAPHSIQVTATNINGSFLDETWTFTVRQFCLDDIRMALPREIRERDPSGILQWLRIWDGIFCYVRSSSIKKFENAGLIDPDLIPKEALQVAFEDAGLIYPDFPEISTARKRRLLKNADEIHATRYSIPGLQFYISLLTDANVEVRNLNRGYFFFFNSQAFGYPTPEMMNSAGSDNDVCTYLIGPRSQQINITITGILSEDMKEFLRQTIFREIPMSDDPVNPLVISIVYGP